MYKVEFKRHMACNLNPDPVSWMDRTAFQMVHFCSCIRSWRWVSEQEIATYQNTYPEMGRIAVLRKLLCKHGEEYKVDGVALITRVKELLQVLSTQEEIHIEIFARVNCVDQRVRTIVFPKLSLPIDAYIFYELQDRRGYVPDDYFRYKERKRILGVLCQSYNKLRVRDATHTMDLPAIQFDHRRTKEMYSIDFNPHPNPTYPSSLIASRLT